ncbi:MAG TPA: hypothetical protein VGY57_05030 [Vicinamibacterales bacterium]|nr:hypothetical protein [Vicinamibacterales bacterium]
MAETLQQYGGVILAEDGTRYYARTCGAEIRGGMWQAWIEFVPVGGGTPIHTWRETTQPNRVDTVYWATGLSRVYLEGALRRALSGPIVIPTEEIEAPTFDEPARRTTTDQ